MVMSFPGIPDFVTWGYCASSKIQENFDITKYQGEWWEISGVPNEYVKTVSCTMQNYTQDCYSLKVNTTGLDMNQNEVIQTSKLNPGDQSGLLILESEGAPAAPYEVLETDYINYSCVYSCLSYGIFKAEFMWVFSRTAELSSKYLEKCDLVFKKFDRDTSSMTNTKQGKECPLYSNETELVASSEEFIHSIIDFDEYNITSESTQYQMIPSRLADYCTKSGSSSYKSISVSRLLIPILFTRQFIFSFLTFI
ncbi:unnamed protein product [Meganyctiphanes norvegica]|uniref:Lipocalin/cytosolic fatty-acid binding domain-containing protein n=1 Tax=Meganyctiphanes norvegica TaxID=48144 RepID=A0AAV2QJ02_MEGNR